MKVLAGVFGILILLGVVLGSGYVGFTNGANQFENQIKAQYDNNRNIYDNGWKKVRETAQVPDMYADKVKEVFTAAIQGRYGTEGAKNTFLAIREVNPNIDASLYRQIQQTVEEFHNEFAQNQTRLVAIRQEYQNYITATTSGRFYNTMAGYPRIDLSKYDIVTSEKTEHDFETKRAPELKLKN